MEKTFQTLNELETAGLVTRYAIGGAFALIFYTESSWPKRSRARHFSRRRSSAGFREPCQMAVMTTSELSGLVAKKTEYGHGLGILARRVKRLAGGKRSGFWPTILKKARSSRPNLWPSPGCRCS